MKAHLTAAALLAALPAAACGGPGDQVASACIETGEMPDSVCSCIGDRANTELTAEQKATLATLIETADDPNRGEPTPAQIEVALFLTTAALECQAPRIAEPTPQ